MCIFYFMFEVVLWGRFIDYYCFMVEIKEFIYLSYKYLVRLCVGFLVVYLRLVVEFVSGRVGFGLGIVMLEFISLFC